MLSADVATQGHDGAIDLWPIKYQVEIFNFFVCHFYWLELTYTLSEQLQKLVIHRWITLYYHLLSISINPFCSLKIKKKLWFFPQFPF
jgi:hypothetical protein